MYFALFVINCKSKSICTVSKNAISGLFHYTSVKPINIFVIMKAYIDKNLEGFQVILFCCFFFACQDSKYLTTFTYYTVILLRQMGSIPFVPFEKGLIIGILSRILEIGFPVGNQ